MLKTLMVGLTEKDLTAVLRTMLLSDFYLPLSAKHKSATHNYLNEN